MSRKMIAPNHLPYQNWSGINGTQYTSAAGGMLTVDDVDVLVAMKMGYTLMEQEIGSSRLLGTLQADMNITTDQPFTMLPTVGRYMVDKIVAADASINLTTAAGGVYDTASKGGVAVVAASQAYTALSTSALGLRLTIAAAGLTWVGAAGKALILALTTGQGAAATANFFLYGFEVPALPLP